MLGPQPVTKALHLDATLLLGAHRSGANLLRVPYTATLNVALLYALQLLAAVAHTRNLYYSLPVSGH